MLMSRKNVEDIYPLSPLQQGILYHTLVATEPGVYFVQHGFLIEGPLDITCFERAFQDVVDRHPILRTAFVWERRDRPMQVVRERAKLPFAVEDLRAASDADKALRTEAILAADRARGFELQRAPLLRVTVIRLRDDAFRIVWSVHHLLLDGWSTPLVTRELFAGYEAHLCDRPIRFERPRPYGDYIGWLQKQDPARAHAFFGALLHGFHTPTPLGVDRAAPVSSEDDPAADLRLELSDDDSERLAAFARRHHLTPSTIVLGAHAILLSRYAGEEDVLFGATVSGRSAPLAGIEKMIGLFINTLPVRVRVPEDETALSFLTALHAQQTEMREHEHLPLVELQRLSDVPRGTPLFESLFVFENFPFDASGGEGPAGLVIRRDRTRERTHYPLTVVAAFRRRLSLRLGYDRRRFDDATIARWMDHLRNLVLGLVAGAHRPLRELSLLGPEERDDLVHRWNDTTVARSPGVLLHQLVEAQVDRTPDAVAVTFEGEALTYRDLDERANRVAHHLRSLDVGPDARVGVFMDRGLELPVALLGVLKAGGAYLPLDPSYPKDRLKTMLVDAGASVLLVCSPLLGELAVEGIREVAVDADASLAAASPVRLTASATPDHLAYVIYTSGSTGTPKGVMIPHRAIVNHMAWMHGRFPLGPSDAVLQKTPIAFDASVWEFWAPLMGGARLVMACPGGHRDAAYLASAVVTHHITDLQLVPSVLALFVEEPALAQHTSLKRLYAGGEALPRALVERFKARCDIEVVNLYGPTECTVQSIVWVTDAVARGPLSPIGLPIDNVRAYVLDAGMRLVPIGVMGELCIGGAAVGRGYIGRPDLTAERFVPDPFSADPSARLYRTGDLVRRDADGVLTYVGRLDHQIKLRGHRIELGEIEAVLRGHATVRDAAVVVREDRSGDRRLAAYVVSGDEAPRASTLRAFVKDRLPDPMVPSSITILDAFPTTPSGKLDRRALPAPDGADIERVIVAPRGPIEEAIAAIFADVLRLDPACVGAHDGFFDLGGHSLLATAAMGRIRAAFNLDLPLRAIFESTTPAHLAAVVQATLGAGAIAASPPLVASDADTAVLSFAQERLWFLTQLDPGDPSYNIPLSLRLQGRLDVDALQGALTDLADRHEVLRTTIASIDGRPVPVAHECTPVVLDVRHLDAGALPHREAAARREALAEARRGFDLAIDRPFRAVLLVLGEDDFQLLVTMHHIVSDGWSLGVLYRDLSAFYRARLSGAPARLPDLPIRYRDYAAWQRAWLSGDTYDRELAYWRERLSGAPRAHDLPTDRPRAAVPSHRGGRHSFTIAADLVKAVKDLSRREGVTPFMAFLAAFEVLLHRYTGQTDLLVGTPSAGRGRTEMEGLVGFFVNTLVLRVEATPDLAFRELLQRVKESALGAFAHQDMPFEQLVRELVAERDPSRAPLVQVSFTLQAEPTPLPALPGIAVRRAPAENTTAKFDLTLALFDGPSGLVAMLEHAADLFDASTIERMAGHFVNLLTAAVRAPERRLAELSILSDEERNRIVEQWNRTDAPWPEDATIHDLFEAQVDRTPDATALLFEGRETTYRDLDARANQLAHHLISLGVGPESRVGISLHRSPEMIVALLGTLKAGGAWVPLDPAYPRDRLAFMIADAGLSVLLTEAGIDLPASEAKVVRLDADAPVVAQAPSPRPTVNVAADDPAYVIYTSGSTGRPKGVVVEHRGLGNVAAVHRATYGVGPGTRILQFSSLNFDASVWEIVMALLNGATLVLAPQEALLPGPDLVRTLVENRVSILTVPPSVLSALPWFESLDLETIVVAGEACPQDLVDRWAQGRRFFNAYGPTEASICASQAECFAGSGKPTIGKPIANVRIYIVDALLKPVPIGVAGELCIGGVGVARGYLNRPELTAEKLVASPFVPGERLYRTGDRARYRADGAIEFLGREDEQVKLRGFRIELGEIDAALRGHAGVLDAVTVLREEEGTSRLVAYIVPRLGAAPSATELRVFLEATLPPHMVPAVFVQLGAMPLTPNGKVDRRALPAPAREERAFVAPRGPVEEAIAGIFAEVLKVGDVGAHDGFFVLGGHSLVATQAVARIRDAFGIELPLRALFESPTPAALAAVVRARIEADRGVAVPPIERVSRDGDLPLSFGQERLWFLAQLEPDNPAYVISSAARLRGPLDVGALSQALTELVRRHETLRTTFAVRAGRPAQMLHAPRPIDLSIIDLSVALDPLDAARIAVSEEALARFDLERGPLFRARLFRLAADDHALVLAMHHIVSDGWSQAVIHRELAALYEAFAAGRASPLVELPVQYVDYAAWQRAVLGGETFDRQIAFWKETLGDAPRALDLPADRARPPVPSYRGDRRPFSFPIDTLTALSALARREGATLFMTLLAAFEVLLHRLTAERDLVVGTPVAGRARAETEALVGFFINSLVLRVEVAPELAFRDLVCRVRDVCLAAYAHQDVPFERLVQELAPERDLSRAPLFQVMFTLQNEPREALVLPGLQASRLGTAAPTAKLDLSLAMHAGAHAFGGVVEYATDLFDASTIDRLIAHLGTLLAAIARDPDARVDTLPILSEEERYRIVETWSTAPAPYPKDATIHALFEAQAALAPEAGALLFEGREISYRDLDERANRMANHLRRVGIGPESRVGISLRRSPEMIIAVLGTLKAGGAWVPLDPAYPRDRLAFMIADAGLSVLLTEAGIDLPAAEAKVVRLDVDASLIAVESPQRPVSGATASNAAYVIYTSGSTGRPKGVVVEHRGLGNVAAVHRATYGVGPGTRVLQFSSLNFDASVWEIVMALLNGATLVLAPQEALLPGPDLVRTLVENRVSILTVPPSVLSALPWFESLDLETIVVAGEACPQDLVDRWAQGRRFFNAYGPTEASICATQAECFAGSGKPTIGKPIANARIYIVDALLQPVPIGVAGELCIGGVGVARGYLNRPELTAEKLVASPFVPGERLYRTGDRARYRADGAIEFLGRVDEQVKLRGFRIELGEIDAALRGHAGVLDAVTVLREEEGTSRLVAYIVPHLGAAPSATELRVFLEATLPPHMVPSVFVPLASMPLTPNGKVDRRALPLPAREERAFVAPRGPVEEAIAGIFAEVLKVGDVGAHDGFFERGGHSLLATRVVFRIRDLFGLEVPLRALFDAGSPAGLAAIVEAQRGAVGRTPIERVSREAELPLSFAQERLWFLDQLEPGSASYVVPLGLRFSGPLDEHALARTLQEITRRHEVLRTTFAGASGKPLAVVHEAALPLTIEDVTHLSVSDREAAVAREAAREAETPFDLARGPVVRARLLRLSASDRVLLFAMHHVVTDGWSLGVILHEIAVLYGAFARGEPSPLADLDVQYVDWAVWQRRWLEGGILDAQLAHWRSALAGAPRGLDLPTDRPRPKTPSQRGDCRSFHVSSEVLAALETIARHEGATLYMTVLSALMALLQRTTGQRDIVVGAPIAGRTHSETEGLIGFFTNTLAMRADVDDALPFVALLQRVRETCLAAYAHQDVPFERVVQEILPDRDPSRAPIFQVTLTLQNEPPPAIALPGLTVRRVGAESTTAKFDLVVSLSASASGLNGSIAFATDLFDGDTVERLAARFATLLAGVARDPAQPICQLPVLPEAEQHLLARAFHDGEITFPQRACLHEIFAKRAAETPDRVAVTCEGESLRYGELKARADRVARLLIDRGVGPDVLVGLCMDRSIDLVVAIVAVLTAGGAYLPLDPEYPRDRLAFMIEDADVSVIVTQARHADMLSGIAADASTICIDGDATPVEAGPTAPIGARSTPENLAYVIYTSGSTGKPKGAMVTHHNVVRLFDATEAWYRFGSSDVWALFHSYAFDFSVWELWGALLYGGRVVVVPYWVSRSPDAFHRLLVEEGVTVLNQTPSAFRQLVHAEESIDEATRMRLSLRYVIFGGEALDIGDLRPWWDRHGDTTPQLVNMYGITETTVHVTYRPVSRADLERPWSSVIGRAIPDLRIDILDGHRQLVPIGVAGEMYVGGAGVSRGYLARPELTAERFVDDPYRPENKLYRTGDLARRLPNGDIEYLGRIDHQVKIRGFRIELGEIEAVLEQHAAVREAVVIAREDRPGDKRLVGYVVLADGAASPADLRALVAQRLPEYMVPSAFVMLDALPLGPTGKIDRRALPAPEDASAARLHVAPRGPVEEVIAGIYADVLRAGEVGAHDGFFELGGHSLLATQAMARVREAFGVEVPLRAIFEEPTVAALAAAVQTALERGAGATAPPLTRVPRGGHLPISFAQERLWLLDQLDPGDASYIVPMALRLEGPLDVSALSRALSEIVRRHEVLRTTFTLAAAPDSRHALFFTAHAPELSAHDAARPVGVLLPAEPTAIPIQRWPALTPVEREEAVRAVRREMLADARLPFDLARGPLLRARLHVLSENDHVLSLTMHHIVSDAWTQGVFARELGALYEAFAAGRPSPLAEPSIQYADFAAWQRAFLHGEMEQRQLAYWRAQLAGAPAALDLPTDRPRPPVQTHAGGRRTVVLPAALLAEVNALARREGATLFMTLLAAFDVLLHRITGQSDIVVGSPIAGRTRAETEGLVGFFVNTLVLRVKVEEGISFRALVRRVRDVCLGAYAHQDMPFERLVTELAPDRDLTRTPLFQVMFALQNAGAAALKLPGLTVQSFATDTVTAKFDLTLVMGESPAGLVASFEHNTDLFDGETIDRFASQLRTILEGAVARPEARVFELPILSEEERRQLAGEGVPALDSPPCTTLTARLEARVSATPDAPAVTFEGRTLTYRDLDEQANRVAHALRKRGIGPETLVGLCMERSLDLVIALLGILKAGGAYLPLDPDYPPERLAFMVEDSKVPVIVTTGSAAAALPEGRAELIRMDADAETIAAEPASRPEPTAGPENLAYVIYTSGSTGKPKGAMVTHHNVVRLFDATEAWYRFGSSDVWTLFHSYAFDFSVWELWGALLYGGRVVVVPYWVSRSPDAFHRLLVEEGVTVLNQTPSAFRQLVHAEESIDEATRARLSLRYVIFGGEALDIGDLRPWWDRHGDTSPQLVNMYGITETTVHVTYRPVSRADLERPWSSVIGRAIPDLWIYILDGHRQLVPIGVAGEMYVGGAGVSRGYLARPELTAERFADDPYRPGNKLYRTGDLARRLPNGDIEYLGRIDHQVKIRGFRIELGEIEAVLEQHAAVREAVVIARQDGPGDKRLVGYLVAHDVPRPTVAELRAHVKQKLPEVMVPAAFVFLAALPLTDHGKVDRRALPAPEEGDRAALGEAFVAPANAIEEQLARIWASVLRVEQIGIHDNFFAAGGDSILSIQIVARAEQAGLRLTPRQIFQHPTIAEQASVVGTGKRVVADQGAVVGALPLTPIQRWWLEQDPIDPHHWNQAFFLEVRERMDAGALEAALEAILDHHDALRLRLARVDGEPHQTIARPGGPVPVRVVDLAHVSDADLASAIEPIAAEAQGSLDLEAGPIVRVVLFDLGPGRASRLLWIVHHLAVDGVSWRILLDDLWSAYEQHRRGERITLPRKTTSFQRWSERLVEHARSEAIERERSHWHGASRRRARPAPVDATSGENTEQTARFIVAALTPMETEALLRAVPEAYRTQIDDILLAAFAQAWGGFTGSPVTVVDREGHGREELFDDVDLTRTVGWFTAIHPLVIELPDGGPDRVIKSVKEQIRAVPRHGVGYGVLRYLGAAGVDLAALPEAEASFNYLGQLDQAWPLEAPFRFAREPSGSVHSPRARRRHLVDVVASVTAGKLSVRFTYSEARHARATIEALAEGYLTALRALVDHCLSPEAGGYTPSDFQAQGLSQNVIDMLSGVADEDA
ncbi:Siderophore biosynthesis non-ribosomal peptide synthetase [Minicystis rosea]|nr:Siderophore biosynthesis non-ribosomal peptide synthetase [Minicystis rosea]